MRSHGFVCRGVGAPVPSLPSFFPPRGGVGPGVPPFGGSGPGALYTPAGRAARRKGSSEAGGSSKSPPACWPCAAQNVIILHKDFGGGAGDLLVAAVISEAASLPCLQRDHFELVSRMSASRAAWARVTALRGTVSPSPQPISKNSRLDTPKFLSHVWGCVGACHRSMRHSVTLITLTA